MIKAEIFTNFIKLFSKKIILLVFIRHSQSIK